MTGRAAERDRTGRILFLLCWIAYFTSYIGRLNYSSAMSSIIGDGILDLTQAGTVSMCYFFAYGIGQSVNGILGDHISPRRMIFLGLFLAGAANFFMGLAETFPVMAFLWAANGLVQSMIWPPIMRVFAEKFSEKQRVRCSVDIVSSMAAGTLMSYLTSAVWLRFFRWQAVFFAAAALLAAVSFLWIFGYSAVDRRRAMEADGSAGGVNGAAVTDSLAGMERSAGMGRFTGMERSAGMNSAAAADSAGSPRKARKAGSVSLGTLLIRYGLLSILFPVMIHGMIKDGVTQWVPTYLSEQFALSASASAVITMVLPLLNLTGAYLARFAGRNHPDEEIRTSIVFFAAALVSILGMLFFGKYSVVLTVIFFGAATSSMMAADTLFINMIPLHFGPIGCVSTVSGFLNSMAYLGSAFSVFGIGVMVKKAGWPATISMWALLTAAALCVCVVCRKQKFSAIAPEKSV